MKKPILIVIAGPNGSGKTFITKREFVLFGIFVDINQQCGKYGRNNTKNTTKKPPQYVKYDKTFVYL